MRWSKQDYDAYQARRAARRPHAQPPARSRADGKVRRAAENGPRFFVRVVAYRSRLADHDGLTAKYFVDLLRYSGIIVQDDPGRMVSYSILQEKVSTKKEERTLIEVIPV